MEDKKNYKERGSLASAFNRLSLVHAFKDSVSVSVCEPETGKWEDRTVEFPDKQALADHLRDNGQHVEMDDGSKRRINLRNVDLTELDLSGINFGGMHIEEVDFEGSDLSGASFHESWVDDCNFSNASLIGTDMSSLRANKPNRTPALGFEGATLKNVDFSNADIGHLNLQNAHLNDVNFAASNIDELAIKGSEVKNTKFDGAKIHMAWGQTAKTENVSGKSIVNDAGQRHSDFVSKQNEQARQTGRGSYVRPPAGALNTFRGGPGAF